MGRLNAKITFPVSALLQSFSLSPSMTVTITRIFINFFGAVIVLTYAYRRYWISFVREEYMTRDYAHYSLFCWHSLPYYSSLSLPNTGISRCFTVTIVTIRSMPLFIARRQFLSFSSSGLYSIRREMMYADELTCQNIIDFDWPHTDAPSLHLRPSAHTRFLKDIRKTISHQLLIFENWIYIQSLFAAPQSLSSVGSRLIPKFSFAKTW